MLSLASLPCRKPTWCLLNKEVMWSDKQLDMILEKSLKFTFSSEIGLQIVTSVGSLFSLGITEMCASSRPCRPLGLEARELKASKRDLVRFSVKVL